MKIRIDKLDELCARVVKNRDGWRCQRCGGYYPHGGKGIQAAHVFSRRKKSTRYNPDVLVTLCAGCHSFFHSNPHDFIEFAKEFLGGEKYEMLRQKSLEIAKPDHEAILAELEAALKRYE